MRETLWPHLLSKCDKVTDARKLLKYAAWYLDESHKGEVTRIHKETSEGLVENLPHLPSIKDHKDYVNERELIALFHGQTLVDTITLIDGMEKQIESSINAEMKDRGLKDLNVEFYE